MAGCGGGGVGLVNPHSSPHHHPHPYVHPHVHRHVTLHSPPTHPHPHRTLRDQVTAAYEIMKDTWTAQVKAMVANAPPVPLELKELHERGAKVHGR